MKILNRLVMCMDTVAVLPHAHIDSLHGSRMVRPMTGSAHADGWFGLVDSAHADGWFGPLNCRY